MRFIFATDTHATGKGPSSRTDSFPMAVKRKLTELAQAAKANNVEAVIHGGDLFDKPVVSLQLTGEIADIIRSSGVPWYVVPGNHDLFGYNIKSLPQTSLGLLEKAGVVTILDRKHGELVFTDAGGNAISFEGQEYHKDIDHRDPALDYYVTSSADYKVLVPHSMLLDKEYFPDVPYTNTKDLSGKTDADAIFVGHYHDGFKPSNYKKINGQDGFVFNPGSMLRDEASKGNLIRTPQYIVMHYTNKQFGWQTHIFQSHQPGHEIFDRSHITNKAAKDKYLQSFEQKLSDVALDAVDVRTVLDKIIKADPSIDNEIQNESYERLTQAEQVVTDVGQSLSGYTEKPNNISIKEIRIKGFQSHEDTTITLGEGFNAITGPSDSGKSAIIRALRFALYNEPRGSEFIRQQETSVSVFVAFSDGTALERSRTKATAGTYRIYDTQGNPTEIKGFTNHVPVDIANTHQMPKIQLTKDKEASLNMGFQLEGPFLIGESPSTRAQIIGQLTGVELVDHALKELNKDILGNTRDIKLKSETITSIDNKLEGFSDLVQLEKQIESGTNLITRLELTEDTYNKYVNIANDLSTADNNIDNVTRDLSLIPDVTDTLRQIAELERSQAMYEMLSNVSQGWTTNSTAIIQASNQLSVLPEDLSDKIYKLEETSDLFCELSELQEFINKVNQDQELYQLQLDELTSVDTIQVETLAGHASELESLIKLNSNMQETRKAINANRKEIRQALIDAQEADEEYNKLLEELGTCPTCGQETRGGHLHGLHTRGSH